MFPSFNSLDQNPSSKQDHDPPFLFNFPSPFLDEHESPLSQIFLQNPSSDQNQNNTDLTRSDSMKNKVKEVAAPLKRRNLGVVPRRRTGKKDRHSKICTAQGIRDRRMRLSLQVARKFFDLQDMLGFDKASKTIEWLFSKSNKAIKELADDRDHQANYNFSVSDAKSESFISECEVVSGLIHEENTSNNVENGLPKMERTASNLNARESREKARARARCRTRAKIMAKGLEHPGCKQNPNFGDAAKLGFSPYEAGLSSLEYPLADVSMIEKFLGNSISTSSWGNSMLPLSALVGCANSDTEPNCSFLGFFGNSDLGGNPNSIYSASGEFQ